MNYDEEKQLLEWVYNLKDNVDLIMQALDLHGFNDHDLWVVVLGSKIQHRGSRYSCWTYIERERRFGCDNMIPLTMRPASDREKLRYSK